MASLDEAKRNSETRSLLKKRKRNVAATGANEEEAKESTIAAKDANVMMKMMLPMKKTKKEEDLSSAVYKSLFDNRKMMANDGMDGKYEGDFMTRSAKFGLQ